MAPNTDRALALIAADRRRRAGDASAVETLYDLDRRRRRDADPGSGDVSFGLVPTSRIGRVGAREVQSEPLSVQNAGHAGRR